jgi:hypothetical protein
MTPAKTHKRITEILQTRFDSFAEEDRKELAKLLSTLSTPWDKLLHDLKHWGGDDEQKRKLATETAELLLTDAKELLPKRPAAVTIEAETLEPTLDYYRDIKTKAVMVGVVFRLVFTMPDGGTHKGSNASCVVYWTPPAREATWLDRHPKHPFTKSKFWDKLALIAECVWRHPALGADERPDFEVEDIHETFLFELPHNDQDTLADRF